MCRFHDICLNHSSLEWQYYVDPEEAEVPLFYHYLNGHAVYEFPGDFIMTGHVHILPYTSWAPKVCPTCLPQAYLWLHGMFGKGDGRGLAGGVRRPHVGDIQPREAQNFVKL